MVRPREMRYNINMNKTIIPQSVKASLWSYNVDKIDLFLPAHRTLIIHNVLNSGTSDAIYWLRQNFSEDEIIDVIKKSSVSIWDKKSLALWSLIFDALPTKQGRFT